MDKNTQNSQQDSSKSKSQDQNPYQVRKQQNKKRDQATLQGQQQRQYQKNQNKVEYVRKQNEGQEEQQEEESKYQFEDKLNSNYSSHTVQFNERLLKEEDSLKIVPNDVTSAKNSQIEPATVEIIVHSEEEVNNNSEIQLRDNFKIKARLYEMCSEQEIKERSQRGLIDIFEQDPRKDRNEPLNKWMIKSYLRTSVKNSTPENIRSPDVLLKTVKHIVNMILDANFYVNVPFKNPRDPNNKERTHTLDNIYYFASDRFKAIRQDITIIDYPTEETIYAMEIICRFYAIFLYEHQQMVSSCDLKILRDDFSSSLIQLINMYEQFCERQEYKYVDNQYEVYSYNILFHTHDLLYLNKFLQQIPDINHSKIQTALKIINAIDKSDYYSFFVIANSLSYLDCCVIFPLFSSMRAKAIDIMKRARLSVTSSDLEELLFFESVDQTIQYLKSEGFNTIKLTAPVEHEIDKSSEIKKIEAQKEEANNKQSQQDQNQKCSPSPNNLSLKNKIKTLDSNINSEQITQPEVKQNNMKEKKVYVDWKMWTDSKSNFIELNSKIQEKKSLIHYPEYKQTIATTNSEIVTRAFLVMGAKYFNSSDKCQNKG